MYAVCWSIARTPLRKRRLVLKAANLPDAVCCSAADLSEEVPRGATVYVLKHVLHGCQDEAAAKILRQCKSVLPPDGRVLVIEFVLPDVVDHADAELEFRLMSDLNMLAVTGGKERSSAEWKHLLTQAGLECRSIVSAEGDLVSIIEAAHPAA